MTKTTNKEMFNKVLAVLMAADIAENERQEMTAFIESRIEQLDKKANTVSKAEKEKAKLNECIAENILAGLATIDKPCKVSELIKNVDTLSTYSTQKITPIMTALVKQGKLNKTIVKREAFYSLNG